VTALRGDGYINPVAVYFDKRCDLKLVFPVMTRSLCPENPYCKLYAQEKVAMSVNIFISHKSEDLPTAKKIRDSLKELDREDNVLKFFLSEEMPQGEDWYQWIKKRLVESNLLLLLFTDAQQDWGWCLYEAGLFDRLEETTHHRIICLHPTNLDPPRPLKHLQSVPAELSRVRLFLEHLYTETQLTGLPEPIAPWLTGMKKNLPDEFGRIVDTKAQEVISLIRHKIIEVEHFSKYLFLHISDPNAVHPDQIPADALVTSQGSTLRELFGFLGENRTWGEIVEQARSNKDSRWIDELTKAVYQISRRKAFDPLKAPVYTPRLQESYCPLLYRVDWGTDGTITFKVLFYKEITWHFEDIPPRHGNLLTSVVMATRFRYELLEKYGREIAKERTEEKKEQLCGEIVHVIQCIEEEAEFRHMFQQDELISAFAEKDQPAIRQMYA
jgi:hypothetical protein